MIIGPGRMRLLGLLAFLVVCILLALPRMGFGAEPYQSTADYYTRAFLGYDPQGRTGKPQEPEMWKTVKCYDAVGKKCPKPVKVRKQAGK